ncbi:M23 family metallopeptidase [Maribacter sp. 2304DJ31-5]|uniref:M23 family metallopeptidase n=1 Tax=Maribacter sp. 2304DJ31-5 TaxID=3386273 RepID=UPI0039BC4E4C
MYAFDLKDELLYGYRLDKAEVTVTAPRSDNNINISDIFINPYRNPGNGLGNNNTNTNPTPLPYWEYSGGENQDQDQKPCKGDPVKNPEIVSSGKSGKKGGTFGCTRKDSNMVCGGVKGLKNHDGIDIKAKVNTSTFAMHDATVSKIRNSFNPGQYKKDSYGNFVLLTAKVNGKTIFIKYNHLNKVSVKKGDKVKAGDIIGINGNTGNAAAKGVIPHIHIQTYDSNWKSINPANFLHTKFDSNYNSIPNKC